MKATRGAPSPSTSSEPQPTPGTILIVEDEPMARKAVRILLTRNGYNVLEAADASEALAVWAAHRPEIDLILADMEIPGALSGLQVCQRAVAEKPGVKAIVTSGNLPDKEELELLSKDSIPRLAKPCPPGKLLEAIAKCLRPEQGLMRNADGST